METINLKGQATTEAKLRRALERIIQLYTDKSHFLYELLQNAEDAKATCAKFVQYEDRLEFFHDGQPFTQSNFDSLCDVGNSDKIKDLNQIGEFGVGFKSVFSICKSVKLYNQPSHHKGKSRGFLKEFAVEIEDFTQPKLISFENIEAPFTTRFVFPFAVGLSFSGFESFEDLKSKLSAKLQGLAPTTLLFMKTLRSIEYQIISASRTDNGKYTLKEKKLSERCTKVTASGQTSTSADKKRANETNYLVFSKPIDGEFQENASSRTVDIAFLITKDNKCISKEQYVSVYFPTETESKLNFIVQGPFRTTPNRTSIPADNPENIKLAAKTAELLKESIIELQKSKMLDMSFLSVLPLDERKFENFDLFKPLYCEVLSLFSDPITPMLPTLHNEYVTKECARLARSEKLTDLFSDDLLSELLREFPQKEKELQYKWLPIDITETNQKNRHIYDYLTKKLRVKTIRPDDLKAYFEKNPSFLQSKRDEWLIQFYNLLSTDWRSECDFNKGSNLLASKIILTSDGEFNAPYTKVGDSANNVQYIQNIFPPLMDLEELDYRCVDEEIYKACTDFFENVLRLQKLDNCHIQIERIKSRCKKYVLEGRPYNPEEHVNDIHFLCNYYQTEYKKEINVIIDKFLLVQCSDGKMRSPKKNRIYFSSYGNTEIKEYLKGISSDYYILDSDIYERNGIKQSFLEKVGVISSITEHQDEYEGSQYFDGYGYIKWISSKDFSWKLSLYRIDKALNYIFEHPNAPDARSKSKTILSILIENEYKLKGDISFHTAGRISTTNDEPCELIRILRGDALWTTGTYEIKLDSRASLKIQLNSLPRNWNGKWLLDKNKKWVAPWEITQSELDSSTYGDIKLNSPVYTLLGFKKLSAVDLDKWRSSIPPEQFEALFEAEVQKRFGARSSTEIEKFKPLWEQRSLTSKQDFPTARIKNWNYLRKHVAEVLCYAHPRKYDYVIRHIRTSSNREDVRAYLETMYSWNDGDSCACQMCHKITSLSDSAQLFNYTKVELSPLNLNLCPNCARKFRTLRSNEETMDHLRRYIMELTDDEIDSSSPVEVSLRGHVLWFTQIHIAEIREILRLQYNKY